MSTVPTVRMLRSPAVRASFVRVCDHFRSRGLACIAAGDLDGAAVAFLVDMHLRCQVADDPTQHEAYLLAVRDAISVATSRAARARGAA